MASYIEGVQDYIPNLEVFTPDYQFLNNVLNCSGAAFFGSTGGGGCGDIAGFCCLCSPFIISFLIKPLE